MPGKILTIAIHKGGAGKTTAAVHLAFRAAERGHKTLLVDLDAQGNASYVAGGADEACQQAADLFDAGAESKPVHHTSTPGLDLLPADPRLLAVERLPVETADTFGKRISDYAAEYDVIVVDTPPTMGFAMLAPLLASSFALAPVVPDGFSVQGVHSLIARVEEIRAARNPSLRFLGLLVNKWNKRNAGQNAVVDAFQKSLGGYLIPHALPESTAISAITHTRQPVWKNARSGSQRRAGKIVRGAMDWLLDEAFPTTTSATASAAAST